MKIDINEIKELITSLGFKKKDSVWEKNYQNHDNFSIKIDFLSEKILYGSDIRLGDKSTSNFCNSENFVVLECVNRLLEKGYDPRNISLEHKWSLGHANKGKLDILVKRKSGKSYLMIECKTWGNEFEKEYKKMLKNGGQLFSYYQQDQNVEYLCLYTSNLNNLKNVTYKNKIIKIEESFALSKEIKETYERWNKQFADNGIFEKDREPYLVLIKTLKRKDLTTLDEEDSGLIYNQFLEILRHNTISDKSNAFDKIFNLFLCKIRDEDKNDDEELDFQWIDKKDTYQKFFDRLNILYKEGMKLFLNKEITDYTEAELTSVKDIEVLSRMANALRLYRSGQDFGFTYIYNEESFEENALIVKEIVELLQNKQLRYTHKQQFLGDFFELLLNTGFKQESGQFFTPIPLVRSIINSLPLKEIMTEKIKNGNEDFLPYTIDFACGSGHFLTELMDELQNEINNLDTKFMRPGQRTKFENIYKSNGFNWSKQFIYGIEKDYRLVKTTKLACFLHGDGEAQIIHSSGLAPFNDERYIERLHSETQNNEKFDLLIANPPYSISNFISTVKNGKNSFTLFNNFSDKSNEIEILFIERMKQLVKPNGHAVIILPSTILTNDGNSILARKMILENFDLKAVIKLGGNAFMKTGTNTVTLFLKKKLKSISLINSQDYLEMAQDKNILVVQSQKNEDEKNMLGYSFSERKGKEGIKIQNGLLTNSKNKYDESKISSYILRHLKGEPIVQIEENLKKYLHVMNLSECFDFNAENFENKMNLKKKKIKTSEWDLVKIEDVCYIKKGISITKKAANTRGNIPVIAGGKTSPYNHDTSTNKYPSITISTSGTAGYVWYHDYPIWASDCLVLTPKENVSIEYVYVALKKIQDEIYDLKSGKGTPHVYEKDIAPLQIPWPPKDKQKEIASLLQLEKQLYLASENYNEKEKEILSKF